MSGLSAGTYGLRFQAYDNRHKSKWYIDSASLDTAYPVAVTAGQSTENIDVELWLVPGGSFTDDNQSIFVHDIEWLAISGITQGCNPPANTMFCPSRYVTRAEMAAFLARALELVDRLVDPFVDDDGSIFEADIEKLAKAGITQGCNPPANTMFCPSRHVTRAEMAAFLVRALGYADPGRGDLFVDDDDSIFEGDIDKLGTANVTRGCNPPLNTMFCPDRPITREQMAAFLHRALGN